MAEEKVVSTWEQVEARKKKEAEKFAGGSDDGSGLSSKFIRECLQANKLGDGILYAEANKDDFLFDKSSQTWMTWLGHHWGIDVMDNSLAAVENVSDVYLSEAARLVTDIEGAIKSGDKNKVKQLEKLQKKYYSRVWRLRESDGRRHCRDFGQTNPKNACAVSGEHFNVNPWLLGCSNGVINLRTGALRPGRRNDYITKASLVEYKGIDAPCPELDAFLLQIFKENDNLVAYINRLLGYGITGTVLERVFPIFWGDGWNGKSTLVEVVSSVLGPLAGPMPSEMLLDQGRFKGSTGPSPDIMALRDRRIAFASETDEGRWISPSRVKWLSGADTVTGRNPYDRYPVEFIPSHLLILLTNHKPNAPADDFAFWERVHLIPFELSFVLREPRAPHERPADKNLKEKLLKNPSGVLAWLVRGCLEWQERGLDPPPIVTEATAKYHREEDNVQDFIDECCFMERSAEIKAAEIYGAFCDWWKENISPKPLSQKKFGRSMARKFKREKRGCYIYYGIDLLGAS